MVKSRWSSTGSNQTYDMTFRLWTLSLFTSVCLGTSVAVLLFYLFVLISACASPSDNTSDSAVNDLQVASYLPISSVEAWRNVTTLFFDALPQKAHSDCGTAQTLLRIIASGVAVLAWFFYVDSEFICFCIARRHEQYLSNLDAHYHLPAVAPIVAAGGVTLQELRADLFRKYQLNQPGLPPAGGAASVSTASLWSICWAFFLELLTCLGSLIWWACRICGVLKCGSCPNSDCLKSLLINIIARLQLVRELGPPVLLTPIVDYFNGLSQSFDLILAQLVPLTQLQLENPTAPNIAFRFSHFPCTVRYWSLRVWSFFSLLTCVVVGVLFQYFGFTPAEVLDSASKLSELRSS